MTLELRVPSSEALLHRVFMLHGPAHAPQRLLKESLATVVLLGASDWTHDAHAVQAAPCKRGASTEAAESTKDEPRRDLLSGALGFLTNPYP